MIYDLLEPLETETSLGFWLAGFRLRIRSDLLLRKFHVDDQHIEIFDGLQESDSDSCVLNNFFDVRKEWIFTLLFVAIFKLGDITNNTNTNTTNTNTNTNA